MACRGPASHSGDQSNHYYNAEFRQKLIVICRLEKDIDDSLLDRVSDGSVCQPRSMTYQLLSPTPRPSFGLVTYLGNCFGQVLLYFPTLLVAKNSNGVFKQGGSRGRAGRRLCAADSGASAPRPAGLGWN